MERDLLIHLAENDILEMILMTLQDENFQVREKTVELLGRLTDFNPAFIFLKFRRVLLESISQLGIIFYFTNLIIK
jgi:serine/threonine-protein kinase mTOR